MQTKKEFQRQLHKTFIVNISVQEKMAGQFHMENTKLNIRFIKQVITK